jgi:hypothetical protein
MSAQEQDWQDDQERDLENESGEDRDPTQQPPTHHEGEREVGDHGEEQGSEPPAGDSRSGNEYSDADRAVRREQESLDRGDETPA